MNNATAQKLTESISGVSISYRNHSKIKTKNMISEFDMVSRLAEELKAEFSTDIFVREFAAGYGIADLVFARSFISSKNTLEKKPISNYYALLLYLSVKDSERFTSTDARLKLKTNTSTVKNAINYLIREGYVAKIEKNLYKKIYTISRPELKLVAIEAKLRDWKQGIKQARRYKSFTNESYLALLSKYEKNVDYAMLDDYDIGLILVDEESGEIVFKRKPIGERPRQLDSITTSLYADELFLEKSYFAKTA